MRNGWIALAACCTFVFASEVSLAQAPLVSCPAAQKGQDLNLVQIRVSGTKIDETDGDDNEMDWDLTKAPTGRVELACGYSRKGDHSLKIAPGSWIVKPIPREAKMCSWTHGPEKASCSNKPYSL